MKKLLTLCVCLVSAALSFAQQLNEPFGFPIKPGTKEWSSLKTEEERFKAMQIPSDLLPRMTTESLVATCLNHPTFLIYITSFDLQTGYNVLANNFNGIKELENRNDAEKCLVIIYNSVGAKEFNSAQPFIDKNLWTFKIAWIELLLSQDKLIKTLDINEKNNLLSLSMQKFAMKISSEEFSGFDYLSTTLLIARIMKSIGSIEFEFEYNNNESLRKFIETAQAPDSKTFDSIHQLAHAYVIRL